MKKYSILIMTTQIEKYKERILTVLKKHEVKRASLFGSIIREEMTEQSDIDILIEFEGDKSLLDLAALTRELEETLQCKVDVLTYNSLHPLLRSKILSEQVKIL